MPDLQKSDRLKKIIKESIGNCHVLERGGVEFIGGFSEGWDAAMEKILQHLQAYTRNAGLSTQKTRKDNT